MKHYLIRFDRQPSKASDSPALTQFLQERKWLCLVRDFHDQTYGLIQSEESPSELRLGINRHLAPHAEVFLRDLPASELPPPGSDHMKWTIEHTRSGTWQSNSAHF